MVLCNFVGLSTLLNSLPATSGCSPNLKLLCKQKTKNKKQNAINHLLAIPKVEFMERFLEVRESLEEGSGFQKGVL